MKDSDLAAFVTHVLPASLIESLAREHGALRRQRTVWLAPLVWVLVLGALDASAGALAHFWRLYCVHTGARVARSSFYQRLSPALAEVMAALLARALRAQRRALPHWLTQHVELEGVLAVDSSVVRLRDGLRDAYTACAKAQSALKLHAIVNVLDFQLHQVRLSSQTEADVTGTRRVRQWCRRKLVLMDLGYYKFATFAAIDQAGGFFVSRAKAGLAARIVADHSPCQGGVDLVDVRLTRALRRVRRHVLDVDLALVWREQGREHRAIVRAVGIWDAQEGRHRVHLTNLDRARYPAREIGPLYRLRWGVELVFKQLKSDVHVDRQTSAKEHIVRLRMDSALLAYCLTGRLCARLQRADTGRPYPVSRGLRALSVLVPRLLDDLCAPWATARSLGSLFAQMTRDPNEERARAYDPLLNVSDLRWAV